MHCPLSEFDEVSRRLALQEPRHQHLPKQERERTFPSRPHRLNEKRSQPSHPREPPPLLHPTQKAKRMLEESLKSSQDRT